MGFSRQEYWSGFPFPSPGDLPDPEIEPRATTLQADSLLSELPWYPLYYQRNPHSFIFSTVLTTEAFSDPTSYFFQFILSNTPILPITLNHGDF